MKGTVAAEGVGIAESVGGMLGRARFKSGVCVGVGKGAFANVERVKLFRLVPNAQVQFGDVIANFATFGMVVDAGFGQSFSEPNV